MDKKLGYAKCSGSDIIWEIVADNEDRTVDININDIQGDITIRNVLKNELILVEKKDYDARINKLTQ